MYLTGQLTSSPTCTNSSIITTSTCTVEPGADITLISAENITFTPGFHAKLGSNFVAKISDGPIPPPPTASINISSNNILSCDSITLSWSTSNATDVYISPVIGEVNPTGNISIYPRYTTTYTITATNEYGCATAADSVTVTVNNSAMVSVGGTATASGDYYGHAPSNAFDSNTNTYWHSADVDDPTDHWLRYELVQPKVVTRYSIQAGLGSYNNFSPKEWYFQGSNNGSNWTTLDSHSNETQWNTGMAKVYDINNTQPFRYYRICVTEVNKGCSLSGTCNYSLVIIEMKLYAFPCDLDIDWLLSTCGSINYCSNDDPDEDGVECHIK
jgi:hypothetical protein